jgi:hypothetical protein
MMKRPDHAKESSCREQRGPKRALDNDQGDDDIPARSDGHATLLSVMQGRVIPIGIEGNITFMLGVGPQEIIFPVFISAKRGEQSSAAP